MTHDLKATHKQTIHIDKTLEMLNTPQNLAEFRLSRSQRMIRRALHTLDAVSPHAAGHLAAMLFLRPRRKPITYTQNLPDGAQRIAIYHDLYKLTAYSWGGGDRTVLLVHGWESQIGRMLPLVSPLVEAGFRVVALDSPGHGQSPRLLTDMYDVGEAVYSALEQLAPVHSVIANSFGAAATTNMLARKGTLHPPKLVLISPMAHIEQHIGIFNQLVGVEGRLETHMRAVLGRRLPLPFDRFDLTDAVTYVDSEGLIIHDVHDPVIPFGSAQAIAEAWPNATFLATQHLGHKKLINNIHVQAAIVDFLTDAQAMKRGVFHVLTSEKAS